ncbi:MULTISPECIES: GNAT family N-acetyltransferase [Lactobacillales]|jgi:predicted GNAT family acetyltransferase|uniref:N-acetyltransferase n=4 Tax=Bacteria TaxID=2 RepID=A0A552YYL3_9LACT|nr:MULTISPECIES: GNAT family N-acetyltransferase [Lactococcus]MSU87942.1 N-acetyltransferase [Streptococcus dysgalactiae subsp. dysgalactiae]HBC2593838.1 N-acetyltransferase [Enterococcus faecalis]MCH5426002.1 GNAT family N-acetyltransferase [Lactococcus lactis]MCH5428523.1 GNAT family N-acetyltransferase [Lactococcus lactis]MCT0030447.1 N-acetyltransferase [Lactococcus lactis subsp. lactis]
MEIIEKENKFLLLNDEREKVGEIDFENNGGKLTITHTEVQKVLRKEGLGERLVLSVVEKARETDLSLGATCPYAANYIKHHKRELEDVL